MDILLADSASRGRCTLSNLQDLLNLVYDEASGLTRAHLERYYRVHIGEVDDDKCYNKRKQATWGSKDASLEHRKNREVNVWCFSPGFAMQRFGSHGAHSVILTSGTLSPLTAFASELMLPFPVTLENPHVIKSNQVWVGVLTQGPGNVALSSAYVTRNDPMYKTDLGNTIVNLARIIPAGLLVFFPSYSVMRSCLEWWHQGEDGKKSIWQRIEQVKFPVVEPQKKQDFHGSMQTYYEKVKTPQGAIFFAVCRGKVRDVANPLSLTPFL